jgi:hypothetical protein
LVRRLVGAVRAQSEPLHQEDTMPIDSVFVFGSNLAGRHGKGAALWARQHRGAIYGQGVGRQGNAYAIPIKDGQLRVLPLGASMTSCATPANTPTSISSSRQSVAASPATAPTRSLRCSSMRPPTSSFRTCFAPCSVRDDCVRARDESDCLR